MRKNHQKILLIARLAIYLAMIAVMSFTPIGYLRIATLEVTLIPAIVAIVAIDLGIYGGLAAGATFGILSFVIVVTGGSVFMGQLFNLKPFATAILCIVPRILEGVLTALIYKGFKVVFKKIDILAYFLSALACVMLNTLLFMSVLFIFFYHSELIQNLYASVGAKNLIHFFFIFIGFNALLEVLINPTIATLVLKPLSYLKKDEVN